jgi:hypothetical protein
MIDDRLVRRSFSVGGWSLAVDRKSCRFNALYLRHLLKSAKSDGKNNSILILFRRFVLFVILIQNQSSSTRRNFLFIPKNTAMIVVHDIFICKPGNASKVAKMFKEAMGITGQAVKVMTDMTGAFNKVVMVSEYETLAAYEQSWEKYMQNSEEMKKMAAAMSGYQDMYLTGSREIYRTW